MVPAYIGHPTVREHTFGEIKFKIPPIAISRNIRIPANSPEFFVKFTNSGLFYDFTNVSSSFTKTEFCFQKRFEVERRARARVGKNICMKKLNWAGTMQRRPLVPVQAGI